MSWKEEGKEGLWRNEPGAWEVCVTFSFRSQRQRKECFKNETMVDCQTLQRSLKEHVGKTQGI